MFSQTQYPSSEVLAFGQRSLCSLCPSNHRSFTVRLYICVRLPFALRSFTVRFAFGFYDSHLKSPFGLRSVCVCHYIIPVINTTARRRHQTCLYNNKMEFFHSSQWEAYILFHVIRLHVL